MLGRLSLKKRVSLRVVQLRGTVHVETKHMRALEANVFVYMILIHVILGLMQEFARAVGTWRVSEFLQLILR